jgi:hypothetical protein
MSAMATLGAGPVSGIGRGWTRAGTSACRNASTSGRARDVIVPTRRDDGRVVAGTRAGRARSVAARASSATTVTRTREEEVSTDEADGFPRTRVPGDDVASSSPGEKLSARDDPAPLGPYSVWPRVPDAVNPATSPRRLFLATVAGALVAETAGQLAERTMESELARLRLEQRRRSIANALQKFGFVVVDDRPRQIVSGAEAELARAGTISGLALVGAVGSRGIAKAKTKIAARRKRMEGRIADDEKNAEEEEEKNSDAAVAYDVAKTVIFSACYTGLWQPHWFNVLNSYDWTGYLTPGIGSSAALESLGSSVAPLLVNQLVVIPLLYWPAYFLFTGVSERTDVATSLQTLHARLPELMRANLTFWLPAQAVQFAYVPVEDQAVYVAVMGVVWNGILATLSKPGRDAQRRTGAATYGAAAASADEAETEAS